MDPKQINRNTRLSDLSTDSLDIAELIMALEEKVDIEIPDGDVERFVTMGDIIDYLERKKQRESRESLLLKIRNIIEQLLGRVSK